MDGGMMGGFGVSLIFMLLVSGLLIGAVIAAGVWFIDRNKR